ncbi:hypothetical protein RRG08_029273, partial [Elysia crispata]
KSWGLYASLYSSMILIIALVVPSVQGADDGKKTALLIVDVQECFLPGGSLSVTDGNEVIPVINWIRETYKDQFSLVAVTKDWHCDRHVSFANSHSGKTSFEDITLRYTNNGTLCLGGTVTNLTFPEAVSCPVGTGRELTQTLWPVHCVQNVNSGPTSSKLDTTLLREADDVIINKGMSCHVDFYSAFFDIGRFGMTNLDSTLQSAGIDTIIITGLALDYCVKYTALDGRFLDYDVYVVKDATRGVAKGTSDEALAQLTAQKVHVIDAVDLSGVLHGAASPVAILSPAVLLTWVSAYMYF